MKKVFYFLIVLSLSLLVTFRANAQAGWKWGIGNTHTNVNSGGIDAWPTAIDASGNVFLSGSNDGTDTNKFGPYFVYNTSSYLTQAIIVKVDSAGNYQWARGTYNNDGEVSPVSMVTDAFGNLFFLGVYNGSTCSIGSFTLSKSFSNPYSYTCFLVKISSSGGIVWAKNVVEDCDNIGCLGIDASGNLYVTEDFIQDSITIGTTKIFNNGISIFIAKFNTSGNAIWAKSIGNQSVVNQPTLAVTSNDKIYLYGVYSADSLIIGNDTISGGSSFLTKFDINGTLIWAKNLDDGVRCNSMAVDGYDNTYMTGSIIFGDTTLLGPDTLVNVGGFSNVIILKNDSAGNIVWAHSGGCIDPYGVSDGVAGYGISVDICGNVWTSGEMLSGSPINFNGHILNPLPGSTDPMFIVEYDNSGNYMKGLTLKSGGDDQSGIIVDNKGDFYLTGDYSGTPMIFGNDSLPLQGSGEYLFITKYTYDSAFLPNVGAISGPSVLCVGSKIKLNDSISGGTWSSSNKFLSTVESGIVTGISAGIDTVKYTVMRTCSNDTIVASSSFPVTIFPTPDAGAITGPSNLCIGDSIILEDTAIGGVWSEFNNLAGISGSVKVIGLLSGTDTISYSVSNYCGTDIAIQSITINPLPILNQIIQEKNILSVAGIFSSYQWTLNGQVILGATNQTYTIANTGAYSIFVTNASGCIDTYPNIIISDCSIEDMLVFPNPTQSIVYIYWCKNITVKLNCIDGKSVTIFKNVNQIDLGYLPNGTYELSIFDEIDHKIVTKQITKLSK